MAVMHLEEFYNYKNQLMKDLLTNENIVKLINEDVSMDEAFERLAYHQVFPCEYLPETVHDGSTFICFDVDIQESYDKTFLAPVIYIWVFSHRSQLRLPDGGGVRPDKICSEIDKVINGSRYYGLGELNLYSVRRFAPQTDYIGKQMTFRAKEVNKFYDPKKSTPTNRRDGE